jgi:hypothetical protein
MPAVHVQFWAGDSIAQSVRRAQTKQAIACSDRKFDEGFWMTYADFRKFVDAYVLSCREWQSDAPLIDRDQWKRILDSFLENK